MSDDELRDALIRADQKPLRDALAAAARQAAIALDMRWRGDWEEAARYTPGDVVLHECGGWVCVAPNTDVEPPSVEFWDVLVCEGPQGEQGPRGADGIGTEGPKGDKGDPGDPAVIDVQDEGNPEGPATTFNFTGAGVTASVAAGVADIDIPGGGGGVTLIPDPGANWAATTVYALGDRIDKNGVLVWEVTTAGTSSGAEPAGFGQGHAVITDNTVVWQLVGPIGWPDLLHVEKAGVYVADEGGFFTSYLYGEFVQISGLNKIGNVSVDDFSVSLFAPEVFVTGADNVQINGNDYTRVGHLVQPGQTANTGGATNVELSGNSGSNFHDLTLFADTTFTFVAMTTAALTTQELTLVVHQDGTGGWTVTWPGSVVWIGAMPTLDLAANAVTAYKFLTFDDGTTWYGSAW